MRGKSFFYCLMIGLVLLGGSMTGCVATQGQKFTGVENPPAEMSVVYFYRGNKLLTNSTIPGIVDNGEKVLSRLPSGTYWKYYITPGKHVFEPKQFGLFKKDVVTVTSKGPGEVHFVELKVNIGYIGLISQKEKVALTEIAKCFEVKS